MPTLAARNANENVLVKEKTLNMLNVTGKVSVLKSRTTHSRDRCMQGYKMSNQE